MITITNIITFEEGYAEQPYYCSEGYPTVAQGIKLGPKDAPLELYKFTVPKVVGELWSMLLLSQLNEKLMHDDTVGKIYANLSKDRQNVLLSMAYQMGINGLKKFRKMWAALDSHNYEEAEIEALDSVWYRENSPNRARRHALVLKTGNLSDAYGDIL